MVKKGRVEDLENDGELKAWREEWAEAEDFRKEFSRESERGAVILGAAYLDECLRRLIGRFLIVDSKTDTLLKNERALGTFSSRIEAAYCMGLISEDELRDLAMILKIRNLFAHELHGLSFSDQRVRDRCSELDLPKKVAPLLPWASGGLGGGREAFDVTVALLVGALKERIVERREKRPSIWTKE